MQIGEIATGLIYSDYLVAVIASVCLRRSMIEPVNVNSDPLTCMST